MNCSPAMRTAGMTMIAVVVLLIPAYGLDAAVSPEPAEQLGDGVGPMNLANAVALALERNPSLAAFPWDIRAAEARALQASLRPNPELSLNIENVRWDSGPQTVSDGVSVGAALAPPALGTNPSIGHERASEQGSHSGFRQAQFTIGLSQLIELGAKRMKRIRLAEKEIELAQWDYEAARADVLAGTAKAFVEALAAQERLELETDLTSLAEEVARTIGLRVKAGEASPLESSRAEVALASTRVDQERAVRELEAVRIRLAAMWGSTRPEFERVVGKLDEVNSIPPLEELTSSTTNNPDLARWASEIALREAAIRLQRANRVPDPTLSIGFRSTGLASSISIGNSLNTDGTIGFSRTTSGFDVSRDNSVVLGLSVPIPVFNRNQGGIKEAEHLASKAAEQQRAANVNVQATLSETYQILSAAHIEITALKSEILPRATGTFDKINRAYREGKFSYLDVLDAQRTLFAVRTQYLAALTTYHTKLAEIERLTGQSLLDTRTLNGNGE